MNELQNGRNNSLLEHKNNIFLPIFYRNMSNNEVGATKPDSTHKKRVLQSTRPALIRLKSRQNKQPNESAMQEKRKITQFIKATAPAAPKNIKNITQQSDGSPINQRVKGFGGSINSKKS